ncbi:hypothetical protein I2I11_12520 [Pontibacter sp. 172403-2]|uniref:hypothetical protein n=1 Tax=Pontibacter rufus TaxID=2791028 RepID=UPI0018AF76E1|nr:hypothetical protein [Pontibacter sp. 172403-2]MBF9254120.1 hypothetical protein [Pontibacter sp. 172403-2]
MANRLHPVKRIAKYIFYIIYNVIYQIVSFWFLLYLDVYINGGIIPNSFIWKNNLPRTDLTGLVSTAIVHILILSVEAAFLILFIYFVNKLVLGDTERGNFRNTVINRTAKINTISFLGFIAVLIWGSFRGYLW